MSGGTEATGHGAGYQYPHTAEPGQELPADEAAHRHREGAKYVHHSLHQGVGFWAS